ncbi:cuticle protein 10.9-like [Argiope bruennichi]|uniref:cuticle protein 10.9-like n=1 Tax=Argiope bruennichi TaxID=94029 RepID=UPI0024948ADB|nr:cuticle protein 10.9-like [Argiope bruennichi]
MKAFIVLCMFVAAAVAQEINQPIPYSFNYAAPSEDGGSSSHQESGDGSGRVSGSYSLNNLEGHSRTVEYVADEAGFRATVRTNEPGTANINPADVVMDSSAEAAPVSYSLGTAAAPVTRVAPAAQAGRPGVRYVLVPVTDPRARGYY